MNQSIKKKQLNFHSYLHPYHTYLTSSTSATELFHSSIQPLPATQCQMYLKGGLCEGVNDGKENLIPKKNQRLSQLLQRTFHPIWLITFIKHHFYRTPFITHTLYITPFYNAKLSYNTFINAKLMYNAFLQRPI